jgi:hypothetical protein
MPNKAFIQRHEDPSFNQFVDFYKFLQIGRIVRVDNERNKVDIQFGSNPVLSKDIPITNPFFTGRAFIGGMPETGSLVICGFVKLTNKTGMPLIIGYLDNEYFRSMNYVYNNGKTSSDVKEINGIHDKVGWNIVRLKKRKQYPGDVGLESTHGSEIFLDDNIMISDSKLNEIILSSADRTIRFNSINNHLYTNAARILNGLIIRPFAPTVDPVIMDNGLPLYIVTDGPTIDKNGRAFTEVRTEVREVANAILDVVESYDSKDFADSTSKGQLLVSQLFGTLVGNEKQQMEKYGKVLRPQIFTGDKVSVDDLVCKPNEFYNLASAYQMKFASGTKFDVDKEGHAFVHLAGSSTSHPLGANRSLEFAADGSIRLHIGKNNVGEKSIELNTTGKIVMNCGFDSESMKSCEWNLDRALYINVKAPDKSGFAKYETYAGNAYEHVLGDKTVEVDGSYHLIVKGKIQEDILGVKAENYVNDKMTNYGGNYQEIVVKQKQSKYGKGVKTDIAKDGDELTIIEGDKKETLTLGNKEVKLVSGDSKETLMLGNKEVSLTNGSNKETLLKGNIEESITLGDHKIDVKTGNITETIKSGDSKEAITSGKKSINIKTGDFEVVITSGNITIKTTTGTVNMSSKTQKVTINGMTAVEIISATKVTVNAPMVELGKIPAKSGVVTGAGASPSHMDFLVGLPLKGSMTVKATM